jgi:hypothetical protein
MTTESPAPCTDVSIGEVYLHISNSGVNFKVLDDRYGPHIQIKWSAFGNIDSSLQIATTKSGLVELARLFAIAAEREYGKPYCCEARPSDYYDVALDAQGRKILVELPRETVSVEGEGYACSYSKRLAEEGNEKEIEPLI